MANTTPRPMEEFLRLNPTANANEARARDSTARDSLFAHRGHNHLFDLYGQGSVEVIAKRYNHGPVQESAQMQKVVIATTKGTITVQRCSKCPGRNLTEFRRHNAEVHKKDPSLAFFCPVPGCTKVLYRAESSPVDDHLATHQMFPNSTTPGSRAYELLHTAEKPVLKKLTASTLRHLAEEDRAKVSAFEARKADLLARLPADLPERLTIEGLTVPGGLVDHQKPDLGGMNNEALLDHIVCLRETVQEWEGAFAKAELF